MSHLRAALALSLDVARFETGVYVDHKKYSTVTQLVTQRRSTRRSHSWSHRSEVLDDHTAGPTDQKYSTTTQLVPQIRSTRRPHSWSYRFRSTRRPHSWSYRSEVLDDHTAGHTDQKYSTVTQLVTQMVIQMSARQPRVGLVHPSTQGHTQCVLRAFTPTWALQPWHACLHESDGGYKGSLHNVRGLFFGTKFHENGNRGGFAGVLLHMRLLLTQLNNRNPAFPFDPT